MIGTDDTNIDWISILHTSCANVHPRAHNFLFHLYVPLTSVFFNFLHMCCAAPSLSSSKICVYVCVYIYMYISILHVCVSYVYTYILYRGKVKRIVFFFFFESFIRIKSHFLLCTRVSEYVYICISYFENNQWSTTTKETEVRCNDRSSSRSVVGARNRRNDFEKLSFYFYMGALSRSLTPRQRHLPYILHPLVLYLRIQPMDKRYVW